jgi:Mg-chelatase subunit ChlD
MDEFFASDRFRLKPQSMPQFREEAFVSTLDARRAGLSETGQFCIFAIQPLFPGPPEQEFAVHVAVDPGLEPGSVLVNQNFLDSTGFRPEDERFWSIKPAPSVLPVREAVIELVVEQDNINREISSLRQQRRDLFSQRCLLVEPGQSITDLSLPVLDRGYFNFRSTQPAPEAVRSKSVLVFDENTTLNLFVPHRKSGVDMVIVVDASGSMDLCDYIDASGRARSRIEGVKVALETLLQRRLASGSRVSRIAAVLFGANTRMLYPLHDVIMVELESEAQVKEMQESTRNLNQVGLERLQVDRTHTDISGALRYATELLDYYAQEGNEKMLVLLSDGADWTEDTAGVSDGEIVRTTHDPAVLADSLHYDSRVRIHTVAISDEQALRLYEDRKYWSQGWAIPNTALLRKIADFTEGLFIESPDARALARLFDELGEGAAYPL